MNRDIMFQYVYGVTSDWKDSISTYVSYASGVLVPTEDASTGLSMSGVWESSIPISAYETPGALMDYLYGIKAEWNGDGDYTVEFSLDGSTYSPNLILNPSAEIDASGWSWTVERDTVTASKVGTACFKISSGTLTAVAVSNLCDVTVGADYSFNVWVKGDIGCTITTYIQWYDYSGIEVLACSSDTGATLSSDWVNVSVTDTCPSGSGMARVWVDVNKTNVSDVAYFDWAVLLSTTTTPAVNGQLISGTETLDTTGKTLDIRVTFDGGIADDISELRDLTLTGYYSRSAHGSDTSRDLSLVGAVSTALEYNEPIERNSFSGMKLYGGHAVLSADLNSTDARTVKMLEFLVRLDSISAASYIFDARSGYTGYIYQPTSGGLIFAGHSAVYINGVASATGTIALTVGEWTHILYVFATAIDQSIVIAAKNTLVEKFTGQIGMLASYPVEITEAQALALYNSYSGDPVGSVADSSGITVAELSNSYSHTSLDWAITGAGG